MSRCVGPTDQSPVFYNEEYDDSPSKPECLFAQEGPPATQASSVYFTSCTADGDAQAYTRAGDMVSLSEQVRVCAPLIKSHHTSTVR